MSVSMQMIASALIVIQQTEVTCPKVKQIRETYKKSISDKHEDSIAKFGSILAQGIIDAGGRNATVSLQSRAGQNHMPSIVGLFVFSQFWYWFPLSHFLSLAFTPTCIIGLNSNLKMPKIQFRSNAKPSVYAYPEPLQPPKKEEKEKVSTAILSITAKKSKQKKENKDDAMEVDDVKTTTTKKEEKNESSKEKDVDESAENKDKIGAATEKSGEKEKEEEPLFEMIDNPARVLPQQLKKLTLADDCRYNPVKSVVNGGVIVMRDSKENEPEDLIEPLPASVTSPGTTEDEGDEPEPPEPFEWTED